MGFSQNIKNNAVPEWKDYYTNYEMLQAKLKHKSFRSSLYNELNKVNNFYFLLEKNAVDEKNRIFDDVFTDMPNENFEDLRVQTENDDDDIILSNRNSVIKSLKKKSKGRRNNNRNKSDIDKDQNGEICYNDISNINKNINNDVNVKNTDKAINKLDKGNNTAREYLSSSKESRTSWDRGEDEMVSGLSRFIKIPRAMQRRKKEKNITEFLQSLGKINTYKNINSSALQKLAKKHAEIKKDPEFLVEFTEKLQSAYFYKSKRIELIRIAIKELYRRIFAKNEPEKARRVFNQLRRGGSESADWKFILGGIIIGISFVIACSLYSPLQTNNDIFWGMNNIYLGFFLFGFCLKVFKFSKINYKFIFNFDVCSSLNNASYFMTISFFLAFHVFSFFFLKKTSIMEKISNSITFLKSFAISIQWCALLAPIDILYYNSRIYLIGVYARAILQPLSRIKFRHFYFVDVALSYTYTLQALLDFCGLKDDIYVTSIILSIPIIRILQSLKRYSHSTVGFPHIMNCLKFLIAIIYKVFRTTEKRIPTVKKFSILFGITNIFASTFWDIFMDWQIFRKRYLFPKKTYAIILIFSIFTRFMSTFSFFNIFIEPKKIDAIMEIIRRFLWTLIRVEVEHLNNCDELRIKNVINLTNGELFYKKDHNDNKVEIQTSGETTATDTETEVERSTKSTYRDVNLSLLTDKTDDELRGNQADIEDETIL